MMSGLRRRNVVAGLSALTATAGVGIASGPVLAADDAATKARLKRLGAVKSWGYQLRYIDFNLVARSAHDLVVIEPSMAKRQVFERAFTPDEIARAKTKPDGSPRIALCYLSIGEAERYRTYWQPGWDVPGGAPSWLGPENPQWRGNYPVRFWEPEWQRLMFGWPEAALDRVIALGFDGVYFDRADVFEEWKAERPGARAEMARFVVALAQHARKVQPDFLVVMQNAEELVTDKTLLGAIDGLAKEDLLFGLDFKEGANSNDDVEGSLAWLRRVKRAGRAVLMVEYVSEAAKIAQLEKFARKERFVPHVADRTLWRLNEPPISTFRAVEGPPPPP